MKNPYIVGKSIYLRHPTLEDVKGDWYEWLSDPEITKYLSERYWPNSIESQSEFFNNLHKSKNKLVLAVCDIKTDKHIGITSLNNINWVHGFAEIALIIGDKNYQSGLNAIESTSLLLKIAFTKLVPQFAGPQRNNGFFTFLINFSLINISFYLFLKIFFCLLEENFLYTFSKI